MSEAAWEQAQQQRRTLREAAIAVASGAARISVLRAAIEDADEHDEDQDAIRYARLMYAEAAAGTSERAEAAVLLATALEAPDDAYKSVKQVSILRAEAVTILRQRLGRKSSRADALLLGEVLNMQASSLDPRQRLPAKRALLTLYRAHLAPTDPILLRTRRDLAHALYGQGRLADAQRELVAVIAALPAPKAAPAPQFMHELAWLLIARGRYAAAASYIDREFAAVDGGGQSALARDTHALRWLIARQQGDWKLARIEAAAFAPQGGKFDYHAALMVLEAERALGNSTAAAAQLAALERDRARGASPSCRTRASHALWQGGLDSALFAIEQRELSCATR